jgi:nonsense-mediated mRNA decay protein 3
MQSICPRCGSPAEEGTQEGTEGSLCPQCILASTELLHHPDRVEVTICSVCGSRQVRGRWQLPDSRGVEELASQAAVDALELHRDFSHPKVDLTLCRIGATRYLARINVRGSFKGQVLEERCEIPVRIGLVACDRCSRIAGKYFQSTVQVRGSSTRDLSPQEKEECKRIAEAAAEAGYHGGDQLSFIQEIKEVRGGVDIVLGSTQLGRHLARAIQEHFGGRILESCKLVGKKDSRDVYRSTLLIRFPRLKRGDIVSYRGNLFEVTGFEGKITRIASLWERRRSSLSDESAEIVPVLGNRADARKAVVVSGDDHVLEILDPETYRTVLAPRPGGLKVESEEEATVLKTVDGFIVLE